MAELTSAGDLRESVTFQVREQVEDEFGNVIGDDFVDQFSAPARIRFLKGGETVIAGRLAGTQTAVLTIRYQPAVSEVKPSWRAVNDRDETIYQLKAITPDERRAWVDVLTEIEVA